MLHLIGRLGNMDHRLVAAGTTGLMLMIGIADHLSGSVLSFTLLYAIPIAAAAWFVSARFAFLLSFAAVLVWLAGDVAAGERWTTPLIPVWNGTVRLGSYFVFV